MAPAMPPAGWYDDPEREGLRWWDGSAWTEHRRSPQPTGPPQVPPPPFVAPGGASPSGIPALDPGAAWQPAYMSPPLTRAQKKGHPVLAVLAVLVVIGLIGSIFGWGSDNHDAASQKPANSVTKYEEEFEEAHDVICSHAEWKYTPECR